MTTQDEETMQPDNEDFTLCRRIEAEILKKTKGIEPFKEGISLLLRRAIDEVIDAPRTGRFTIEETEKTEKTYLGTKVEILLRSWLGFPKGKILDLEIDGIETDVKNTMSDSWMIPVEAIARPCLLVTTDEVHARYSVGVFIAREEHLRPAPNRDGKRGISATGRQNIHWIVKDGDYPKNIWEGISSEVRAAIANQPSGTKRVDALFRYVQNEPISRSQILAVARQKDAMKRLRKNGGARDTLARDRIVLLSGNYDGAEIERLGLPKCRRDEFISHTITDEA
ncbi:MAG TPA: NaeI family type II restriction endonuclease [Terracidiphilus sp.]|jgi:hypothetical protein|nr:NaeI family type II restriction endonuclease [Terracidiphilus sp.]